MKRALFRSFVACLFCLAAAGPQVASGQKCRLAGMVVNARSGAPIKKAEVVLHGAAGGAGSYKASSQAGGWFLFQDVEPGKYRLSASRRGFVRQEYGSRSHDHPGEILTLEPGEQRSAIVIRLSPQGVIAGRVVDEDGEPVSEVRVQALRYGRTGTGPTLTTGGMSTTNDLGEYRLYGLPPGRYYLSATDPAMEVTHSAVESGDSYAPTYFPGTTNPSAAVPLEVTPGSETLGISFPLQLTRTYRVRGRVVNTVEDGSGRSISVVIMPRGSTGLGLALNRSTSVQAPPGRFEISGVVPGGYVATAYWFEGNQRYVARQLVEVANADVEGVYLEILPGVDLAGQVRVDGEGEARMSQIRLFLQPREPLPTGGTPVNVRDDGTFILNNVAMGDYAVTVGGVPKGLYLKSVRMAGQDVLASGLSLPGGRAPGDLEVVLSPDGGVIDGTVVKGDQAPVPGVQVVLVPESERRRQTHLYRATTTDQYGRFQLADIAPGDYKVFAWETIDSGAYLSQDFLSPLEKLGQPVSVPARGRERLQLQQISAEALPSIAH